MKSIESYVIFHHIQIYPIFMEFIVKKAMSMKFGLFLNFAKVVPSLTLYAHFKRSIDELMRIILHIFYVRLQKQFSICMKITSFIEIYAEVIFYWQKREKLSFAIMDCRERQKLRMERERHALDQRGKNYLTPKLCYFTLREQLFKFR